jgi:hypothetical protein
LRKIANFCVGNLICANVAYEWILTRDTNVKGVAHVF